MPLLPGPSLFSPKLLLIPALSLLGRKPWGHSAGGHSGCSAPGEEGRASPALLHPAFLRNVCKGHVPAARAAPRWSSGSAGCAIALVAKRVASPSLGHGGAEAPAAGWAWAGRCRAERAGQQRGAGRCHPTSQIPHPTSLIPHRPGAPRAAPQGPRAPFPLRGCPRKGRGPQAGGGPPARRLRGSARAPPRPHRGRLPCGTWRAPGTGGERAARGAPAPRRGVWGAGGTAGEAAPLRRAPGAWSL